MKIMERLHSLEPLWWSLFSAGGAVAAFLLPVHIFLLGVAVPMGWISPEMLRYERVAALVGSPLVKLYLLVVIVFPLFHAAHRIRVTLEDLRLEKLNDLFYFLCYGGAVGLSLLAVITVGSLP